MNFKNKKIAILGWGINGMDAANYLNKRGAKISLYDKDENIDLKAFDQLKLDLNLGEKYLKGGLTHFDYIFRAPGVYRYLPELIEAEKNGVEVTSAVKVFFDECPAQIIGVTGTKGKGTTSTLIYEILKAGGGDVYLAGNIGYPILELLAELNKDSLVVLELSSFQLIDLKKSPHIAVVLNITTDHLDWHKDRSEYVEAKTNIVKHQKKSDFAVINNDYEDSKNFEKITPARKFFFSREEKVEGSYARNGKLHLNLNGEDQILGDTKELLLRGEHNWENVTAAICAASLAGAQVNKVKSTVFSFKGLEHRLELVGNIGGISFYNDSFSTNPQTTMAAILAFHEPITLILGGFNKGFDYKEMSEKISSTKNIENVVLIGEISFLIKESLVKAGFKNNILDLGKSDMNKVVQTCLEITDEDGVVVLSPATSSFDMFNNYKERGLKFKEAVLSLN